MRSLGDGLYSTKQGYKARVTLRGRRIWKDIDAKTPDQARKAVLELIDGPRGDKSPTVTALINAFQSSGCPDARLEKRPPDWLIANQTRLANVGTFFGSTQGCDVRVCDCIEYADWRKRNAKAGTGARSAELDLQCLSNVFTWAVSAGRLKENPIRNRPRIRDPKAIRKSREVAPVSIQEVHDIARYFFRTPKSAVLGWQLLFEALTGCRTNEILGLRLTNQPDQPGYRTQGALYVRRSKRGLNPWIPIFPELQLLLQRHMAWMMRTQPGRRCFFPSEDGVNPVGPGALTRALNRACKVLGLPKRTSHGLRSFYVTVRRSQGVTDSQIASEIGDRTVSLIASTYGDLPPNWAGGNVLSFTPEIRAWE